MLKKICAEKKVQVPELGVAKKSLDAFGHCGQQRSSGEIGDAPPRHLGGAVGGRRNTKQGVLERGGNVVWRTHAATLPQCGNPEPMAFCTKPTLDSRGLPPKKIGRSSLIRVVVNSVHAVIQKGLYIVMRSDRSNLGVFRRKFSVGFMTAISDKHI